MTSRPVLVHPHRRACGPASSSWRGSTLGVGMLHGIVGRDEAARRTAINTIGPLWDGNEVWLIVAGGRHVRRVPRLVRHHGSPAYYLALVLLLAALMVRGTWPSSTAASATRAAGAAPGTCLLTARQPAGPAADRHRPRRTCWHGLPINTSQNYTGTFWDLLQPYALFTGITLVADLRRCTARRFIAPEDHRRHATERSRAAGPPRGPFAAAAVIGFVIWTHVTASTALLPQPDRAARHRLAVIAAVWLVYEHREGFAFAATTVTIAPAIAGDLHRPRTPT